MEPIIKENVRLDLGEDGALGSPIHEESLIDGQTPFPESLDGPDAHVPAAAGCHQIGADGGPLLAKLLTHLPQLHGKSLQGTLQAQHDSWECVGNQETPTLPVQATSSSRLSQGSSDHTMQDQAMQRLRLCTVVLGRKVSLVVLILIPK